jgi:fermentation-respiration switch protein FrsA (DUF1100 family)
MQRTFKLGSVPGFIGWVIGGYFCMLLLLFMAQRSLIYHPSRALPIPASYGVPELSVVEVPTRDKLKLHAWWRPPVGPDKATIVYLHGNAGHLGDRASKVRPYLDNGYGVLLVSYRYNAGAGGQPNEEGLYLDGRAAYDFVIQQGIAADRIVMYGESLGSGIVTKVASENPVGAVVLEAPYSSIADVAQTHYWYVPARWLLLDTFPSIDRINRVAAPLLILHGEADGVIPPRFGRMLFDAAAQPKEAHFVPGGGHANLYDFGAGRVVLDFVGRHVGR